MRTTLIALLLSITIYTCYAGTGITPGKAKTVAETYYRYTTSYTNAIGRITHTDKDNNGNILYYIVDMDKSGFVIVSGIAVTHPIVAISTSGNYKAIPKSGVEDYLYNLHDHISKLYQLNMKPQELITSEWDQLSTGKPLITSRSTTGVLPLLTTTWNQSPYYNQYCPGGSVTGCVATAMAQIIKYWDYPSSGTGSYSYSDSPYGTLSSNFDSTLNWSIMPNSLSSGTPQNETNAVAGLMYKLGVSVAMAYSPSGSGAYVLQSENPGGQCAQYSYVNYFGYNSSTIQGLVQANFTTTKWDSIINIELNNGRPIEYVGFGADGGHTWVLDGYNTSGLYDMNWGWGGLDDGYFALNSLDPSGIPLGSSNAMLIGIEPSSVSTCGEPTSLAAGSLTTSSAVISWTGTGSPKSYNLNYQVSGAGTWTSVTGITSASYALSALAAGTTYNVQVQQECTNGGSSSFTSTLAFSTTQATCGEPTSLAASSITTSGAVISWVGAGSPKSYNLNYQKSGANSWTSVTGITSASYSLSGLAAGTTYNIQVQQECTNSESSGFTDTVAFSTIQAPCGEPISLAANGITTSGAVISWVGSGAPIAYNLNYQQSGAASWTSVTGITSASYSLSGLTAGTTYSIQVQQECSSGESSSFTNTLTFNTATYCTTSGTTASEYIKTVKFGSINNTVSNDGGYYNYTNLSTGINAAVNYQITLTPGFASKSYSESWAVYIDYNHTGNFELILERKGTGSVSGPIKVPASSLNGGTRMRIIMHRGSYSINPCNSITNGDVQDYTVVINKDTSDITLQNDNENDSGSIINPAQDLGGISVNVYPNPTSSTFNIKYLNDVDVKDISLVDATGKILLKSPSKLYALDVSKYAQGWYILIITGSDGSVSRKLVMITR